MKKIVALSLAVCLSVGLMTADDFDKKANLLQNKSVRSLAAGVIDSGAGALGLYASLSGWVPASLQNIYGNTGGALGGYLASVSCRKQAGLTTEVNRAYLAGVFATLGTGVGYLFWKSR